jgi:hypothetical protein
VSATTGHIVDSTGRFRIIHPFHPQGGKEFEMVARQRNWGEDRVFYYAPDGRLKSFLANITDVFTADAFTRISAGRSAFRVHDLLELRELLDRHGTDRGGGDCGYRKLRTRQNTRCGDRLRIEDF